jgi:Nuclease A inhibitor-like protein
MSEAAVAALKRAAEGLLYMSESDEPFQTFAWEGIGNSLATEKFLELTRHKPGDKIEEVSFDSFFKNMNEQALAQGEGEKETCEQLRQLEKTIGEHLSGVKVFRIGNVHIDIYIVGKTADGKWVGLKTAAVET